MDFFDRYPGLCRGPNTDFFCKIECKILPHNGVFTDAQALATDQEITPYQRCLLNSGNAGVLPEIPPVLLKRGNLSIEGNVNWAEGSNMLRTAQYF